MAEPSDIMGHLGFLAGIGCGRNVVEFGFRTGRSARAFLAGGCSQLVSYDVKPCEPDVSELRKDPRFTFLQQDSATADLSAGCDILFIDSDHTGAHLRKELKLAHFARHAIVLHDTVTLGEWNYKENKEGLLPALREFLAHGDWRELLRFEHSNGLSVLVRK